MRLLRAAGGLLPLLLLLLVCLFSHHLLLLDLLLLLGLGCDEQGFLVLGRRGLALVLGILERSSTVFIISGAFIANHNLILQGAFKFKGIFVFLPLGN